MIVLMKTATFFCAPTVATHIPSWIGLTITLAFALLCLAALYRLEK